MGQYWKLINLDREQQLRFEGMKLGEIMFWEDPLPLVWLLTVPRKAPAYDRSIEPGYSTDTRDLGALNLPANVLELKTFQQSMAWFNGPWWRQRLICVGDHVDGDDLPAGIFKDKEEEEALSGNDEKYGARIYKAFSRNYCDDEAEMRVLSDKCRPLYYNGALSRKEVRMVQNMVKPDYSWDGRPETEWILCNMTTAEYVRASAVAKLTGTRCQGPWGHRCLSLGHVLMTQICWSADPSASMCYGGPITRGAWAGHSFGITTVDNLSQDIDCINKQPWKDSTEKIVKQVLEIWRCDNDEILAESFEESDKEEEEEEEEKEETNEIDDADDGEL
ncbi:hypothetical protein C8Q72DRAFT_842579 [Fomitopsis betulina]|nr:hypothetical protein C8Q72DRAFT_842579 [Fomitopsis betulina]